MRSDSDTATSHGSSGKLRPIWLGASATSCGCPSALVALKYVLELGVARLHPLQVVAKKGRREVLRLWIDRLATKNDRPVGPDQRGGAGSLAAHAGHGRKELARIDHGLEDAGDASRVIFDRSGDLEGKHFRALIPRHVGDTHQPLIDHFAPPVLVTPW